MLWSFKPSWSLLLLFLLSPTSEFWNSSLHTKEFDTPVPPGLPSGADADAALDPAGEVQTYSVEPACGKPVDLSNPPLSGPLRGDVGVRRQYFKNHVKVQVSTEAASPLSPPAAPPPPIPVGKKTKKAAPHSPAGRSRASHPSPSLGVSSEATARLEDYCVPQSKGRVSAGHSRATLNPLPSPDKLLQVMEEEQPAQEDSKAELGHFLWNLPTQERGRFARGGRDPTLSFSGPS